MSRKFASIPIVLLVLVTAAAGCVPVAPPQLPASTAAAPSGPATPTPFDPAEPVDYGPYGQVLWNGAPVAGARVKLARQGACRDAGNDGVLAETIANHNGEFAFPSVPEVEWDVCYAWPEGQGDHVFMIGERQPVMPVNDLKLSLTKPLRLLAPDLAEPLEGTLEVRWDGVPEVATYRVVITDMGTSELIFQQDVPGTSATVPQPLEPGHGYGLGVHGLNASGEQIAVFMGEFMASDAPGSPKVEPVQQIPSSCYREGLLTYIDRDTGICFAYPQGFAFAGAEGSYAAGSQARAELRGPAIGDGPEPLFARLSLDFRPYQGADLPQFVDEIIKRDVPADLAAKVERKQATWGGRAAEVLEPWPGLLSSRVVVVDAAPSGFNILTFWPSFKDTTPGQLGADAVQAQKEMEALYEIVSESFAKLPPPGVPMDPKEGQPAPASELLQSQAYRGASFSYPSSLALSAEGKTVPAQVGTGGPWWEVSPQHVEIALGSYVLPDTLHAPRVVVYPAAEFASMSPQAADQIAALKKLLAAKPENPEGQLPFLPLINAGQMLHLRVQYQPFKSGEGVSYLTQLAQGLVPVNNYELFYTYQGLTADGKYYVSAILPVSHETLPATANDMPAAQKKAMNADFQGYLNDVTNTLSSGGDAGFKPALSDLDALVQSIEVETDALAPAAVIQVEMKRRPDVNPNYTVQQIPAVPHADDISWWDAHPPLTLVTLPGYAGGQPSRLPYYFAEPTVQVYRAADFQGFGQSSEPMSFQGQYEALKKLLSDQVPLTACSGVTVKPGQNMTYPVLPILPLPNASQVFCTRPAYINFNGGRGIRYVTAFAQGVDLLNDQSVFYTFQGLTDDGKYYVLAVLPVTTGILPAQPGEGFDPNTWTTTLKGWVDKLAALRSDGFHPSLEALDLLVGSIAVR